MNHILRCHEIVKTDFVRGENCYLYDVHGKRYVDFEAGIWCTALGHNHDGVNRALQTQSRQLVHLGTCYPSYLAEDAAVEVLDIVGIPDGKCVFLSSGSEAVEFGVQLARRITGRPLLLSFSNSYLAAYGSAGQKGPKEWVLFDWNDCAPCSHAEGCDQQCQHFREIPFESIAGFAFEPGSASGQVRFPPKQVVEAIAGAIKRCGGLLVGDEITTGLGRTGTWFGFQHYAVQPDIVALGKGLGNGYPVSAVAMTGEIARTLEDSGFRYAQSHQNDPLGCAIARAVVGILRQDGLIARSGQVGARFLRGLMQLAEGHEFVAEVRGAGLMIAMEFAHKQNRLSAFAVHRELLERGFLVGCYPAENLIRFDPALTIAEEDIDQLLGGLDGILLDLEADALLERAM